MTLLDRFLGQARAVGSEAELLSRGDFPLRLEALLSSSGARRAVLPATGWPAAVGREVEEALARCGCQAVRPKPTPNGYRWDRRDAACADIGITWCPACLADTGTLVFPSGPGLGTLASLLPFIHLALSHPGAVRADFGAWLAQSHAPLPSRLTLVSGPSRTGDIEGTMSTGVHGPGRLLHWILSDFET